MTSVRNPLKKKIVLCWRYSVASFLHHRNIIKHGLVKNAAIHEGPRRFQEGKREGKHGKQNTCQKHRNP